MSKIGFIVHDGDGRAWAVEASEETAETLRTFVQAHAKLAAALESLAETEIARTAADLKPLKEE